MSRLFQVGEYKFVLIVLQPKISSGRALSVVSPALVPPYLLKPAHFLDTQTTHYRCSPVLPNLAHPKRLQHCICDFSLRFPGRCVIRYVGFHRMVFWSWINVKTSVAQTTTKQHSAFPHKLLRRHIFKLFWTSDHRISPHLFLDSPPVCLYFVTACDTLYGLCRNDRVLGPRPDPRELGG